MKKLRRILKRFIRLICVKPSQPERKGEELLILLNAPSANLYIKNSDNRKMFIGHDLAVVNYMPIIAYSEFCEFKPRYWVIIDPGFYYEEGEINQEKKKVEEVLQKISWKCSIVTSQFADFDCNNQNIDYIRLPMFGANRINPINMYLARHNKISFGLNNVAHASLFFGLTFGYKEIAILGLEYKMYNMTMDSDGLLCEDNEHFYSVENSYTRYTYSDIENNSKGIVIGILERRAESLKMFRLLRKYADILGANIVNYSPACCVEFFTTNPITR